MNFRPFIQQQLRSERLDELEGDEDMSFFFKKGDEIFGAPEESRVTFARLKNPDEDADKSWAADAAFYALSMDRKIEGEQAQRMFTKKDLPAIHVISKEEAIKKLRSKNG